jgi:hypothetical protein
VVQTMYLQCNCKYLLAIVVIHCDTDSVKDTIFCQSDNTQLGLWPLCICLKCCKPEFNT